MLLQVGLTWAYELSEQFSVGIQPTINFGGLELEPNPLASPDPDLYYPKSKRDWATGIGAQFGVFYDSGTGFKAGASYKTVQSFSDFEFESTYLSGTSAPEVKFQMDYPAILSFGLGYSGGDFDLALDYRNVNYENTEGFEKSGWTIASEGPFDGYPTGSVKGFGWENISIVSAGIQYKGLEKVPLRIGYTYSSNPIPEELTFFSVPATAIIKNAFQFGLSYELSEKFILSGLFHYGDSGGSTSGPMLNPKPDEDLNMDGMPEGPWNASTNPLGEIPDSTVSYDMTTSMIMVGFTYNIMKKETEKQ
jgi:long-chain fatty acid transport protein